MDPLYILGVWAVFKLTGVKPRVRYRLTLRRTTLYTPSADRGYIESHYFYYQ